MSIKNENELLKKMNDQFMNNIRVTRNRGSMKFAIHQP
jgi:hypothetical protein